MTMSRAENMRRIRNKDTKPELIVRRLAFKLGYRFRLHSTALPGKPDIVFTKRRKVIFIHGCFWHQHSACREGRPPGTNHDYWIPKLQRTKDRDRAAIQTLKLQGWDSMVVWECELTDEVALTERLVAFLGPTRHGEVIADA